MTEIRVKVADWAVAAGDRTLATIGLGSCVAIALYDADTQVGGLAHVLLPNEQMASDRTNPGKFPQKVVPLLLCEMSRLGALRDRVRAKIVGGSSMFASLLSTGGINVGERNVAAVREVLGAMAVPIVAADTGSDHGRSVYFHLVDGRVEVRSLKKGSCVL